MVFHSITFRAVSSVAIAVVFCLLFGPQAWADSGRVTVTEENDTLLSTDDRHYTQGMRLSYLSGQVTPGDDWDRPFTWFSGALPVFESDGSVKRKYDWTIVGQSIFTPDAIELRNPPANDRSYAGWLYTGAGLLQETTLPTHHRLENLELLAGVVGPSSYAAEVQNDWHQFIDVRTASGWSHQLNDEPGFVLSYERIQPQRRQTAFRGRYFGRRGHFLVGYREA
ncbi:MAG: lipid A deacylase LpxR family protein [Proteobacteria bacterium]|nr:lipid A deacylase LpxR family protein [Pseudomonadota bacterium]